jgi:hypothetical protein
LLTASGEWNPTYAPRATTIEDGRTIAGVTTPQLTLVYMHGGFWVAGAKETAITALMPWLEMGWNVVNVEYRLGVATDPTTLAPAAVDDCFCALRFIAALPANPTLTAIHVVTGESAGGICASMGIIPESVGRTRMPVLPLLLQREAGVVRVARPVQHLLLRHRFLCPRYRKSLQSSTGLALPMFRT